MFFFRKRKKPEVNVEHTGPTKSIPPEIRAFLESILEDAAMTDLSADQHEWMIGELFERLDNFMLTTIVEGLPPRNLREFTRIAEQKRSREELENYIRLHIPNASEVMTRAMLEFRDMYLGRES